MNERPNILLITTDQQRFDALACAGNSHIYTPHLDWLVHEGVMFQNAYADCPACIPSRATIMTGKPGYTTGLTTMTGDIQPMAANPTLPGVLTQAGYQTRAQGKMHFMPMRAHFGFEQMELPIDYIRERQRYGAKGTLKAHGIGENEYVPGIDSVDDDQTFTYWTVQRSIDFLETRDETRPFFMWTSFGKPHPPFTPTQNFWQLYANKTVGDPILGDWSAQIEDIPRGFIDGTFGLNDTWSCHEEQRIDTKRAYYACVTQVDYQLGVLFARMRELGLLENTWIVFTSDHGEMMGDHHMFGKGCFMEGSSHIPMIVRAPSKTWSREKPMAGERPTTLVTLADVMPTILDIAGIDIPETVDGQSMLNFVNAFDARRTFYGNCADHQASIIRMGYKYIYSVVDGKELLFNLNDDPFERKNLIEDDEMYVVKSELRGALKGKMIDCGSTIIEDGEFISYSEKKNASHFRWPGFHSTACPTDVLH